MPRQSAVAKSCGVTIRRRSASYGVTSGAANTPLFLKKQGEFFPPLKISGLPVFRNDFEPAVIGHTCHNG